MNFHDVWTTLHALGLLRALVPAAFIALSAFLPGRGVARLAALGVAVALPLSGAPLGALTAGWCALWLLVAWLAGRPAAALPPEARPSAPGLFESSAVGFAVGLALTALLVAALVRADLGPELTRRTLVALVTLGLGLLHLVLRRRVRRATFSFAALGLGLQGLEDAARAASGPGARTPSGAAFAVALLAVVLMDRVSAARELSSGSDRVALAHDLHD